MTDPSYVHDLAIVLGVAAGTGIVFRLMKQPSILGYLLAGLIVGPYIPIPLFADPHRVHALSELGVVLVMFVIGLEFQLSRLLKVLPVAGFTALIQIATLAWAGIMIGVQLGWTRLESVFLGASIAISSTMIVSKLFEDHEVGKEIEGFVLGILIIQDVAAIALIAAMTAVADHGAVSAQGIGLTILKVIGVLALWIALGLLVVPRLFRWMRRFKSKETLGVAAIGLCFGFALIAEALSYSVALGAFVAGLLVAESGRGVEVEHLIHPIKDMFAAVFFVSIGMSVDPLLAFDHLGAALLVFGVIVVFQFISISVGGILSGKGLRMSLTSGLALGQIGEFAFIISAIGVTAGVVRSSLQPILVTAAVLTAFTTPQMLNAAPRIVGWFDRHLPSRLKNILVVYECWFSEMGQGPSPKRTAGRRALYAIIFDAGGWIVIMAVCMYWRLDLEQWFSRNLHLDPFKGWAFLASLVVVSIPPWIGIARNTHLLVDQVARRRADANEGRLSDTGRAFLSSAIRVAVLLGVGVPGAAVLKPALNGGIVAPLVFAAAGAGLVFLWRSAGKFDHEIRSEAQRLVDFLDRQRVDQPLPVAPSSFFPDIDEMEGVLLEADHVAVGRTLTQLDLRAQTGALVVAIHRDGDDVAMPTGSDVLRANDLVLVTGTAQAMGRARELLTQSVKA